jgi:hypothetical protein
MGHEVVEQFRLRGLRLRRTLEEMLDEHPTHRTERRGCGFTQATRLLSTSINEPGLPGDAADLDLFENWPVRDTGFAAASLLAAGWPNGWRRVDELAEARHAVAAQYADLIEALAGLRDRVASACDALVLPESRLVVRLLAHVLMRDGGALHHLPPMPVKPQIGSCSQAEEFFLELAHGRVRRGGSVNVFVDDDDRALLIEKMGLGESHSAVVLETVCLNGVDLPPGSLCALAHHQEARGATTTHGLRLPLSAIAQARFLRLTTLAVEPRDRRRAFSAQLEAELRGGMLSPATTTLAELRAFAMSEAKAAA